MLFPAGLVNSQPNSQKNDAPDVNQKDWWLQEKPLPVMRITGEDIATMCRVGTEVRTDFTGRTGKVLKEYHPARVYPAPDILRE